MPQPPAAHHAQGQEEPDQGDGSEVARQPVIQAAPEQETEAAQPRVPAERFQPGVGGEAGLGELELKVARRGPGDRFRASVRA
jgi:hypothetical protein